MQFLYVLLVAIFSVSPFLILALVALAILLEPESNKKEKKSKKHENSTNNCK